MNQAGTEGSSCAQGKANGLPGAQTHRSTHGFSWSGAPGLQQVTVGTTDPKSTMSLTQHARNPGRAFLEKL